MRRATDLLRPRCRREPWGVGSRRLILSWGPLAMPVTEGDVADLMVELASSVDDLTLREVQRRFALATARPFTPHDIPLIDLRLVERAA